MTNDVFLQLLRNALWSKGDTPTMLSPEDYMELLTVARQQTVTALVADALVRNNVRTNDDCAMMTMGELVKQQRLSDKYKKRLEKLCSLLDSREMGYVVFKGFTAAAHYPNPQLRSLGDIDFYVADADFDKAVDVIRKELTPDINDERIDKHIEFNLESTKCEMHYAIETFGSKRHQQFFDAAVEDDVRNNDRRLRCNDTDIRVLSKEMELAVIFKHLFNHLLVEGVGLRQLCDMAIMVDAYHDNMDVERLTYLLDHMGYLKAFRATEAMLTDHLGLDEAHLIYNLKESDHRWGDMIMDDVMKGGNFGRAAYKNHEEGWRKSVETASVGFRHCLRYFRLAPKDIACLIPRRIGITVKRRFGDFR